MSPTLLEKAKDFTPSNKQKVSAYNMDELVELCIAYIKGEISQRAVAEALGKNSFASYFMTAFRAGYNKGRIVFK